MISCWQYIIIVTLYETCICLGFYYHYVRFKFTIKNLLNSSWWASIILLLIFATSFTKWILLFYLITGNLQLDEEKKLLFKFTDDEIQNFVHLLWHICAYHCDGVKSNNVELSILFCWKRNMKLPVILVYPNSRLVNIFLTTSSNSANQK